MNICMSLARRQANKASTTRVFKNTKPQGTSYHNRPSIRLCQLNDYVKATGEILARARLECVRNHFELTVEEGRLLQIQLAISKTQPRMLETREAPWKLYLQTLMMVLRTLANREHAARQAQTAMLGMDYGSLSRYTVLNPVRAPLSEGSNSSRSAVDQPHQVVYSTATK
ncbi:hypothetical protein DFH09DRAFT_1438016 [Mycena vulgaris]|nr:hypothetical protein DFH09DRAFT_1438016 [Mycena vulgaris]